MHNASVIHRMTNNSHCKFTNHISKIRSWDQKFTYKTCTILANLSLLATSVLYVSSGFTYPCIIMSTSFGKGVLETDCKIDKAAPWQSIPQCCVTREHNQSTTSTITNSTTENVLHSYLSVTFYLKCIASIAEQHLCIWIKSQICHQNWWLSL